MSDFYVYAHRASASRPDGEVFYIGKGQGRRAWSKWGRNQHWHNTVAKYGYTVEILADNLSESAAFDLERSLILICGRSSLCNLTDGGEGSSGSKHSPETRKKIGERNKGKIRSAEFCELMKKHNGVRNTSPEHRAIVSRSNREREYSEETRRKHAAASAARPMKPETLAKISRPVICSNGMRFSSQVAAAEWLRSIGFSKATPNNISNVCQGKRKVSYGFGWSYVHDDNA